ncbi:uncharacterized protein LOC123723284 [Papilio machaon]|uniref:uncharacterized protein LOC123723284 n=1 Tax=Papilio machaon TaxID=76193 RepID=UPI001E66433D|nr:uncharacterized protein LOC123723284 [Papilio machaon]
MSDKNIIDKKLSGKKSSDKKPSPKSTSLQNAPSFKPKKPTSSVHGGPSVRRENISIGTQSCTAPKRLACTTDAPREDNSSGGSPTPTQELQGTAEEWSDADSALSARASILPFTEKSPGINIDSATQRANEYLQLGKNALEKAGNMKKECKTEANDCLQGLYEIVLCLTESRARLMVALEQEKGKAARELVQCERAHSKELTAIQNNLADKLKALEENTACSLKTAEQIKNWLNLELAGPLKTIANTYCELKELSARPLPATIVKERIFHASGAAGPQSTNIQLGELATKMETVLEQLCSIRVDIERWHGPKEVRPQLPALEYQPTAPPTPNLEDTINKLQKEVSDINHYFITHQSMISSTKSRDSIKLLTQQTIEESLAPVLTHFEEAKKERMELRDILQARLHSNERSNVLDSEIMLTEIRQQLSDLSSRPVQVVSPATNSGPDKDDSSQPNAGFRPEHERSYAQVTRRAPPVPRYNVLVESLDPRHTSDDIVQKLKASVNVVDRGIGVSAIRRSKNQRVIVSCESEVEQRSFSEALRQADETLSAKQLPNKPPLLKLIGLAKDLNDAQVVEALLKQNRSLIDNIPVEQRYIKILKRTKGRNDILTNVIMEVDPKMWRTLLDQRVRVGFQVLVARDQSPIIQCYKCLGYGHMARVCTGLLTCGYCSDHHDTRDCPRRDGPPQCNNCFRDGNTSAPHHPAYSAECPLWQKWDRIARSRVNYC